MRKLLLLLSVLTIFASIFFFLWWRNAAAPADLGGKIGKDFLIVRGESAQVIGKKLEAEGLIKSAAAFKLYTQVTGSEKKIQAGEYEISPNLTLVQVVQALISGPQELWVTYPEGVRREEIAARTIEALELEDAFWFEFLQETEEEEGFLFPDTYLFPRDVKASTVARKLRSTFDSKVGEKVERETVILASIVERETKTSQERPVVAGILLKRLRAGWPLQADATLQYVLATNNCQLTTIQFDCKWWGIPTTEHRKILRSPYNTYLNPGLPPGPIANPGLSSIEAVLNPQDSPYWFYLHDSEGKIHYAETIEKHEENINRYLR